MKEDNAASKVITAKEAESDKLSVLCITFAYRDFSVSDTPKRAKKYELEKMIVFLCEYPKEKEMIQELASFPGKSLSGFLNRAVDETMERDKQKLMSVCDM